MMQREQCASCGIWAGGKEEQDLTTYRGVRICYWCFNLWRNTELRLHGEVSFEELTKGIRDNQPITTKRRKAKKMIVTLR